MKVKTLKDVLHGGVCYPPGKVFEMDKDRAKHLAKKGAVILLESLSGPVINLPQYPALAATPTSPAPGTVPEDNEDNEDEEEDEEEEDPVSKEEKPPEKPPQPQTNRATAPGGQRAVAPPAAGGAR